MQTKRVRPLELRPSAQTWVHARRAFAVLVQAFKRFPALKDRFHSAVINFFKRAMEPTLKLVTDLIKYVTSACVLIRRIGC